MQQNRVLFFGIIGLALLIVIGMGLARLFIPEIGPANVSIQVVAASSIKPWVEQAAQKFNDREPGMEVQLITANDLVPLNQFVSSNPEVIPPAAWIAEAAFVVDMARSEGATFDDSQSIASTSLAWGGFSDNLAQFEQAYGPLNWESVHEKAVNPKEGRFLNFVIAEPKSQAEGLAVLISAVAANQAKQNLTSSDISAANNWLHQTFGENVNIIAKPAEAFALSTGRSIGDFGVLSLASWQRVNLPTDFMTQPLEPNITLDYPFAIYTDSKSPIEHQAAARAFRDFLLAEAQQNTLADLSLEKAATGPPGVQIDGAATQRLFSSLGQLIR